MFVGCMLAWGACRCRGATSFAVGLASSSFGVARPSRGFLSLFIAAVAHGFTAPTSSELVGRCLGDGINAALLLLTPCGLAKGQLGAMQGVFGL